ncbi:type I-PGING CRISPR-associated protein Cas7/Csp1 [Echinicola sp. 20G]|uniref:type I-PGING CRISPR-associated protein Cas7/Csp1 n=1 Tax=Echinicola sp. 20G TaxID=2781961 RepID=UPI001910B8F0|nr:type I-PGING CRISPR-associated protein Cas7/Csp1 [Echinicola sp. 20G]
MEKTIGILVSALVPMSNHIANGGEKLLGNASSIKRTPEGKVYISGQMQRHALFSAMSRINELDSKKGETYVSNGDGISNFIEKDLRADLGGFMHPSKGSYSGRRTSPLSVTPAVAIDKSKVGRDLMVRFKMNQTSERDQALATREFSEKDFMLMNFHLDLSSLSISKIFEYEGEFHVKTSYVKHCKEEERKRRVRLFLEAVRSISDYANQARNAVAGDPEKVLIVFDSKLNRKACRFFEATEIEQENIKKELKSRNAKVYLGDDQTDKSVYDAFERALSDLETFSLYDPSNGDKEVKTFLEAFPEK